MNKIAQFEDLAERLVEGTFARLFAGRISPTKVALHLENAVQEHQMCMPGTGPQAPTEYWVYLNPKDLHALTAEREDAEDATTLEDALAEHIQELAADSGLVLDSDPVVHIEPDQDVSPRDVRVDARWSEPGSELERTREMALEDTDEMEWAASQGPEGRPFLIIDGDRHVNLTQPSTSLGRALDNDIIIEDSRVSRHHAQIRQRYGHMVLYDLDSSGGTEINGYPVEECVLHSGDVISLAGVELIYGEDPPTPIPLPPDEDTPALQSGDGTQTKRKTSGKSPD